MTDEQRKSVALEYLKAFDNGGVTSTGGEHPGPVRRRRAGLLPEVGDRQRPRRRSARCSATSAANLMSIRHDYANFNWIFSGSDTIVAEGTSYGEHKDGPWRAGVPGLGRGALVRRLRDPRLPHPALLHLPRPRLRGQGRGPLPVDRRARGSGTGVIPVSVLDLVPINEGSTASDALRAASISPARRAARLPPLLGGRAPQHARHRERRDVRRHRPPRRRHLDDPRRRRRHHAARTTRRW